MAEGRWVSANVLKSAKIGSIVPGIAKPAIGIRGDGLKGGTADAMGNSHELPDIFSAMDDFIVYFIIAASLPQFTAFCPAIDRC
ncbi:MAG: hypothetical protein JNL84_02995 [Candidatus Accumulibacter sp.]|nr:hypothetical protein [Accumulibacter sp.]